jgi:hypothetical protein
MLKMKLFKGKRNAKEFIKKKNIMLERKVLLNKKFFY